MSTYSGLEEHSCMHKYFQSGYSYRQTVKLVRRNVSIIFQCIPHVVISNTCDRGSEFALRQTAESISQNDFCFDDAFCVRQKEVLQSATIYWEEVIAKVELCPG